VAGHAFAILVAVCRDVQCRHESVIIQHDVEWVFAWLGHRVHEFLGVLGSPKRIEQNLHAVVDIATLRNQSARCISAQEQHAKFACPRGIDKREKSKRASSALMYLSCC
jgi:hypothetical protein